jgi:hydroxyacylglutathione hydrolase
MNLNLPSPNWIPALLLAGLPLTVPAARERAPLAGAPRGNDGISQALAQVKWISGSADCATQLDPPIQVLVLDADTFVLRQNPCIHFEAPFLYLLFGKDQALLLDTGATASAAEFPVRQAVDRIIQERAGANGRAPRLVIAHSHDHRDHVAGDSQFADRPETTVVAPGVENVRAHFGIQDWPRQAVSYDLGDRVLDVMPIPGHHASHIAIFDRRTRILLTGDSLYPGRLYVRDFPAFKASIARLAAFTANLEVSHVLGAHIEMTSRPGIDFPGGSTHHPDEHGLQLTPAHLRELAAALQAMETPRLETHDDFIIYPLAR